MRFLALMQRADMGLQLRVRSRRITASIAHVWPFTSMCALVVVFGLVRCECFCALRKGACVGAVAAVAKEVAAELGALLEIFGRGVARFPVAEAGGTVVYVGEFGVGVQSGGGVEAGEAEEAGGVGPGWWLVCKKSKLAMHADVRRTHSTASRDVNTSRRTYHLQTCCCVLDELAPDASGTVPLTADVGFIMSCCTAAVRNSSFLPLSMFG